MSNPKEQTSDSFPPQYQASLYEDDIYKKWEKSGAFQPKKDGKKGKKPFTISMPPPNATGTLHLGHAIMLTIQDIMTRYHRMKGHPTLWLPGTDHASIATQNKVEKVIAEEGLSRHMLGREKFLERVEQFVKQSQDTIRNQVRKMGSSCDWTREKYTFEPALNRGVREIFVRMYNDGLIYRGNRIVNWCPRCASTLADDEVKHKEQSAKLYTFKYDKDFPFEIATTRPETKLGDSAVAVNPEDERYKQYIGKTFTIHFLGGKPQEIKVIAEKEIDQKFGTGALGVTPAHSQIDFEMAQRHKLPIINVIDEEGKITKEHEEFAGMSAKEARKKIATMLEEAGLMSEVKDIQNNLSICYRCDTPIEPLISKQWFIAVDKPFGKDKKTLKETALKVVRNGDIKIVPKNFEKTYFHWMENLRDWCISRQIWFGHQIPVWYCGCGEIIVQTEAPTSCTKCKRGDLKQDPDTLDTWFSSGLWTFSTLGWPDKTEDLAMFHPTSVLETGYDILFFWVARMILMTTYALDEIPFETVYLHGLVRTREGKKMSKSDPATCIDPLDMIAKYGADALRLSMIIGLSPGNDIRLYEEKISGYRNFVNKIWNASRFAIMNVSEEERKIPFTKDHIKSSADKWIITNLQTLIQQTESDAEKYQLSEAGMKIYDFLWNDFCDWYLEMSKGKEKNPVVLLYVLKNTLKLLHPYVPFVTEAIWKQLGEQEMLITAQYPEFDESLVFTKESVDIEVMRKVITEIRKTRAENHIEPAKKITGVIHAGKYTKTFQEKSEVIKKLGQFEEVEILEKGNPVEGSLKAFVEGVEIFLPIKNLANIDEEIKRIDKDLAGKKQAYEKTKALLSNEKFLEKANPTLIKAEQEKRDQYAEAIKKLEEHRKELENL